MHISEHTINKVAKGDVDAFKELYDSFFPSLASFSIQLIKDKEEAADIVQEALLVYWNKRKEFETSDGVKSFLYKIIKNKGLNYIRTNKIHSRHHEYIKSNEEFYFKDLVIEEETIRIVLDAINDLPPQTKNIIELSMKGHKVKEIAETLDISVNTVKSLKLRAFQKLRENLKDHYFLLFILSRIFFN